MLKYLVILLDDTSVSYCHYANTRRERRLISPEQLAAGIRFAMVENLTVQFVYPDYVLPQTHLDLIQTIDHTKIVPDSYEGKAEVRVWNSWEACSAGALDQEASYVLRTSKADFFRHYARLTDLFPKLMRLNVVLTDVETFTDADFAVYSEALAELASALERLYKQGSSFQLNLLTDRMLLTAMNNCNAGWENITLAPDGRFYVCPAFYLEGETCAVGDLEHGLDVRNPQLYRLDHAPLCRKCDAYQCRRCVWLNRRTTLEVNTPSHEQCVVAHLERNMSRGLLERIRRDGEFLPGHEIKEIDYLDPFDKKDIY